MNCKGILDSQKEFTHGAIDSDLCQTPGVSRSSILFSSLSDSQVESIMTKMNILDPIALEDAGATAQERVLATLWRWSQDNDAAQQHTSCTIAAEKLCNPKKATVKVSGREGGVSSDCVWIYSRAILYIKSNVYAYYTQTVLMLDVKLYETAVDVSNMIVRASIDPKLYIVGALKKREIDRLAVVAQCKTHLTELQTLYEKTKRALRVALEKAFDAFKGKFSRKNVHSMNLFDVRSTLSSDFNSLITEFKTQMATMCATFFSTYEPLTILGPKEAAPRDVEIYDFGKRQIAKCDAYRYERRDEWGTPRTNECNPYFGDLDERMRRHNQKASFLDQPEETSNE